MQFASLAEKLEGADARNKLLEQQINASRAQSEALRHQTQGGMFRSIIDARKGMAELALNPQRRALLEQETRTSETQRLGFAQQQQHAAAAQAGILEGHRLQNEGLETKNANLVAQGQATVSQNEQILRDLQGKADISETTRDEFMGPEATLGRRMGTASKYAQDVAQGNTAQARSLSEIAKNFPQSWVNLPPEWQSRLINTYDLNAPESIKKPVTVSDPPSASGLNLQSMSSAALTIRALLRQLEAVGEDISPEMDLLRNQTRTLQESLTTELMKRGKNLQKPQTNQ